MVAHEIGEITELPCRDIELLRHGLEHGMELTVLATAKLHDTQQEHGFLVGADLAMEVVANGGDDRLGVKLVVHLVCDAKVAVQVKIGADISNSEMVTKITHEHIFCPCFIHLLLFAEKGKQADEAGEDYISHPCLCLMVSIERDVEKFFVCKFKKINRLNLQLMS